MEYVVGFVTDGVGHALLLRKAANCKFEFMRGKLNGVGGAIEPNETPLQAMRREWAEETKLPDTPWRHFCTLHTKGGTVYMFHASSRQYNPKLDTSCAASPRGAMHQHAHCRHRADQRRS